MLRYFLPSVATGILVLMAALLPHSARANDIPVQITVGDTTTLELDGDPSTGHRWILNEPPPANIVTVDIQGFVNPGPGTPPPQPGAPAKFVVLLTAVDAGRIYLVFDYVKPGEAKPEKTQAYKVEVLDDANAAQALPDDGSPRGKRRDLFPDQNDLQDAGGNDD